MRTTYAWNTNGRAKMVNSRKIEDLHLIVAAKCRAFIAACAAHGIDVVITSTFRDAESQNALYAQGRTAPGKKVTNVRGGESMHNWRRAFDFVPVVGGKAIWDDAKTWAKCGALACRSKSCSVRQSLNRSRTTRFRRR